MEELPESSSDLHALLAIRTSENRALKQRVAELRREARQLDAKLGASRRELERKESEDPVVIDLDSDSEPESFGSPASPIHGFPCPIVVKDDIKHEPELPKELVKKRSASPAAALLDDVDVESKIEDVKPRLLKKPRLKVEVVIDSPLRRIRPPTEPRRIGSARLSLPLQRKSPARTSGSSYRVDEEEYPHPADDVDMPQQQGHDDPDLAQPTLEPILQEAVPDLPIEQEHGQVYQIEAARDVSASAEPVPVVKQEEDNKPILALAAETLALLPKVEVKKGLDFDAATIQSRIDAIGRDPYPVTLEPTILATCVDRQFMSSVYGGNSQGATPTISQERFDVHGFKDFFYLNLQIHPYGPREPGQQGLWFQAEPMQGDIEEEWRIFVRRQAKQWLYVGQYHLANVEPLSKEEWLMQSNRLQKKWAREVMRESWGFPVRMRTIFRRDHGRAPTADDVRAARDEKKAYQDLTLDEIVNAYNSGKERIGVTTMRCTSYDERFQRDIAAKLSTWASPPKNITKPNANLSKSTRGKILKKSKGKSSRVDEGESDIEIVGVDEDGGFDEYDEGQDEDDEVQEIAPVYVPRGTKSRPHAA